MASARNAARPINAELTSADDQEYDVVPVHERQERVAQQHHLMEGRVAAMRLHLHLVSLAMDPLLEETLVRAVGDALLISLRRGW